jgi:hypothetical protein
MNMLYLYVKMPFLGYYNVIYIESNANLKNTVVRFYIEIYTLTNANSFFITESVTRKSYVFGLRGFLLKRHCHVNACTLTVRI